MSEGGSGRRGEESGERVEGKGSFKKTNVLKGVLAAD